MKNIKNVLEDLINIIKKYNNIYVKIIILSIIIINFIYIIYYEYVYMSRIIYSIFIISNIIIYKGVLNKVCQDDMILRLKKNEIFGDNLMNKLNEKVLKKNKWLIKPIYYILYYFPTNWGYLTIMGIGRKGGDIRLYINSNKDVIGKELFEKDGSRKGTIWGINKYMIGIKEKIIDIILRVIYIPLYFKIKLLSQEWDIYVKYRIFGIIYGVVLVANNLSIGIGFRRTEFISGNIKLIIMIILIYLCLDLIVTRVLILNDKQKEKKIYEKVFYNGATMNLENKYIYKVRGKNLYYFLKNQRLNNYYFIKDYLIFMCLSDIYIKGINMEYNGYLIKNINKSNNLLLKNMVKIGVPCKINFNYNLNLILKDKVSVEDNIKIERYKNIDIIMICEKNYRKSFIIYNLLFYEELLSRNSIELIFEKYVVYEVLYGEEVVVKYFGEYLEEIKSMYIIITVGYKGFSIIKDNKAIDYFLKLIFDKEIENDIPMEIKNNKEYNNILEMFDFLSCVDYEFFGNRNIDYGIFKNNLEFIFEYIKKFEKRTAFKDIDNEDEIKIFEIILIPKFHDKDLYKQLAIEIYKKKKNINFQRKTVFEEGIKIGDLHQKNIVEKIIKLQEEHKKKYFNKIPKECEFFEKERVLEKGKYFEKDINKKRLKEFLKEEDDEI